MKASVIITCHNYGKYLPECIHSVKSQSYPTEILVVDDSSDEDIRSIVDQYEDVGYLRVEHRDLFLSRKSGFNATRSEVVCMLDADDFLDHDFLATQTRAFADPKIGIVYHDLYCVSDSKGIPIRTFLPQEADYNQLVRGNFIQAGALFRRSAAVVSNAFDRQVPGCYEDWVFFRRIVQSGFRAVKQPGRYFYRRHDDNMQYNRICGVGGYTYFHAASLATETITIAIALAGREESWKKMSEFLNEQRWPHNQVHLILLDNSHSPEFGTTVREWLLNSDYHQFTYERVSFGEPALADRPRIDEYGYTDTEVYDKVKYTVSMLYGRIQKLVNTDYLWVIEDDVIPELDAAERLLSSFCDETVSVAAPYLHRYEPGYVVWGNTNKMIQQRGSGVEAIAGNGLGCTMLRADFFKRAVHSLEDCDTYLYQHKNYREIAKVDWSIRTDHLSKMYSHVPRNQPVDVDAENFDEHFYLSLYPDIAEAIKHRIFRTGFEHYEAHGRTEGRRCQKLKGQKNPKMAETH